MKADYMIFTLIFIVCVLLIDLYTYRGLQLLTNGISNSLIKKCIHVGFWSISLLLLASVVILSFKATQMRNATFFTTYVMPLVGAIILFTIPKIVFIFFQGLQDLTLLSFFIYSKFNPIAIGSESLGTNAVAEVMNRRAFLTQTGAVAAAIPFISIAYGIFKGKYNFRVLKEELFFENLPASFNGLRIAVISDLHIGSFANNYSAVKKGIDMVNSLEADVIFFTGDLVNNHAEETDGWLPYLSELKAKRAKYSILGNHDYGDYVPWNSVEEKQNNLQRVIEFHDKMGFKILLNESVKMKNGDEEISIIGVENWGRPPFPQHGDIKKAMNGHENSAFKILLSHDPSHWDDEVIHKTDIDITFSGHTHGMQFGVEIGNIKWSPVKLKYPRWGGLYTVGKQLLYVNRGFGFIGFPGRVGMPPEITLIELNKS